MFTRLGLALLSLPLVQWSIAVTDNNNMSILFLFFMLLQTKQCSDSPLVSFATHVHVPIRNNNKVTLERLVDLHGTINIYDEALLYTQ